MSIFEIGIRFVSDVENKPVQRRCTGLFSTPETNPVSISKILNVLKLSQGKKAEQKKKPRRKNEQKFFFPGISLKPWGDHRL